MSELDIKIGKIHKGMIKRASKAGGVKYPAYAGCSISPEFKDKGFFVNWYKKQKGFDLGWELDKDILIKGNKVYSPETCILLPDRINTAFCSSKAARGDLPCGVRYVEYNNKYRSRCRYVKDGVRFRKDIGTYPTVIEAFQAYKSFKESYIKSLAEDYKELLDEKAYVALINYSVEIDD